MAGRIVGGDASWRRAALLALAVLMGIVALSAGCTVGTGPTRELAIDESLTSAAITDLEVTMGAGNLSISPGATGLVSGIIRYNVESWKAKVERTDSRITISQGSQSGLSGLGGDIVNDWQLQLGNAPMRLKVSAGAYAGSYDLGGLVLQGLRIKDGASKTRVSFDLPNPGQIDLFQYETGASTVSMTGLANANFKTMEFKGGAGSYTLDFSGELRTSGRVRVKAGVGTVRIAVPALTAARVTVDGSLNDVSLEGTWTTSGDTYSTQAAGSHEPEKTLEIAVDMSVGSLKLISK